MNTSGAPALSVPPANAKGLSYRFQATNDRFGRAFAEIAGKGKGQAAGTMAFNTLPASAIPKDSARRGKRKVERSSRRSSTEPNNPVNPFRTCKKVLAAKPDVIVTGSYIADTTIILREWYRPEMPRSGHSAGPPNSDLIKAIGRKVAEGIISVESVSNEGSDAFRRMTLAYQKA